MKKGDIILKENKTLNFRRKSYEIKTRGEDKYIVLETNSFSTFELSFYTPASVENPKTGDNIMAYVITLAGSVLIIGGAVVVLKKRFNH